MHTPRLARLILCEKSGYWAVALRRHLASSSHVVHETRSQMHCREELSKSQASLVGVELSPENVEAVVQFIHWVGKSYPQARVFVVGSPDAHRFENIVREAGAIHVLFSSRHLPLLAKLVERFMAAAERIDRSFTERVLDGLPWPDQNGLARRSS